MPRTTLHTDDHASAGPGRDAQLLEQAGTLLRMLDQLQHAFGRQLLPKLEAEHGIDIRLYLFLKCIERGAVYPGAISKIVRLPNSVVSRRLDQLVARGLLERSLDAEDSRRIKLTLTRKGLQIAREANQTVSAVIGARLARLTAARRKDFLATLAIICNEES